MARTALLWAALALGVSLVVFGAGGGAQFVDPLAAEHDGILRDILADQQRIRDAREQEPVTNANTANVEAPGAAAGAAMTELGASANTDQRDTQRHRAGAGVGAGAKHRTAAQLRAALHMRGGVATYTTAGHRMRNRNRHGHGHRQRQRHGHGQGHGQTWPEFEGGEAAGNAEEALEEAMSKANAGELTTDDVPELPETFIAWFKYGKPTDTKKTRGRLTYDYKTRKLQIDYFPGGLVRRTYFFNYQKQVRQLYQFSGSVDPTRRSYKKALERKAKRKKLEEEAAENGEELPPLAKGSNALDQADNLVLENEDYTWDECTSWDLVEPYHSMCPTNCYTLVSDPSVASFPENALSDDGGTLDPYQPDGEKVVIVFLRGFIPGMKEGEDDPESGTLAVDHPPLWVRYAAMRNNTPTEIQMGDYVWTFFRWVDLSEWDNFDLKDSGIIEALTKPDLNCIYAGAFTKEVEEIVQPFIPIALAKRDGDDGDDDE